MFEENVSEVNKSPEYPSGLILIDSSCVNHLIRDFPKNIDCISISNNIYQLNKR